MTAKERLEELRQYMQFGGLSESYAGAALFENMLSGASGGGSGGQASGVRASAYAMARIAETARAVMALDQDARDTIAAVYFGDLPHQAQQAATLNIKPRALRDRLHRIHLTLEDWWSVAAKAERVRVGRADQEQAALAAGAAHVAQVRADEAQREEGWNRYATSPARLKRLAALRVLRESNA